MTPTRTYAIVALSSSEVRHCPAFRPSVPRVTPNTYQDGILGSQMLHSIALDYILRGAVPLVKLTPACVKLNFVMMTNQLRCASKRNKLSKFFVTFTHFQ